MQSIDGQTIPVKKTNTKHLLLKKEFVYKDPSFYRIKFATPALHKHGCLTCGRENASVQYYGERYVCQACQQYIQTPSGEMVTLKASSNGRYIIGKVWKNNRIMKGVQCDIDDLRIFGHKCHATFAGEKGDLIILLDEA